MKREVILHPLAYVVLIGGLVTSIGYTFTVWPDTQLLRLGFVALGIGYVLWGISVHARTKDLTMNITLEYFGAALLAVTLLCLLTI